MNYTILGLTLKLTTSNSPLLISPSYSTQNKFLINNMQISHSIPSFYKSFSIKPQKIDLVSSSFIHFLDAAFHIESDSSQYYGEKMYSNINPANGSSFCSCYFYYARISANKYTLYFDSCFILGSNRGRPYWPIQNVYMVHCAVEDLNISMDTTACYMNYTKFYSCPKNDENGLINSEYVNINYANCTKCDVNSYLIISTILDINYMILTKNNAEIGLINYENDSFITNSIYYANNNSPLSVKFSNLESGLYYINSCIFINNPSLLAYDVGHLLLKASIYLQGSCINYSEDEIKSQYSQSNYINFTFENCHFNATECSILDYDISFQVPERRKFNYKVIGDVEEDFEYEIN
ncbi:hypothetical protein M9Y10_005610 [Tritrichomonas musculus]|uniref:Uncharacterized protein n=1 Tax=Tritrichomonas musculus TaxID=1915356 RepID=A0ABR2JCN0_9EUKA